MTVDEINKYYMAEFANDEPININGLLIYPVLVKNYYKFCIYQNILTIDKNSYNDPKIISMSYLEFLITTCVSGTENGKMTFYYLNELLKLVLRKDKFDLTVGFDEKNKISLEIDGILIGKKDFDLFRKLVLVMNIPKYDEEYINPDLKADIEKTIALKNQGRKRVSFEKELVALSILQGNSLENLKNMTMRKYSILLEMQDKIMNYKIYKQSEATGFVEFKQPIPHYMEESPQNLTDLMVDYNSFKEKIK